MRELSWMRDGPVLRLCAFAAALALSSLVLMACASVPAQAPDSTSTPTATPTVSGEQASVESTQTPTPTPTASGAQESGPDPAPTSTATPTPTPSEEQTSDPVPPATTTVAVTTTEVIAAGPPLGDCYGGALSEDPIICYVVKQAEAEGLIDVLGVYEGGEGGYHQLYVSIRQELTQEFVGFSFGTMDTFYQNWPELLPKEKYAPTLGRPCSAFPSCYLWPLWQSSRAAWDQRELLPAPSRYQWAQFVPGGEPGRRDVPGWASWRQLWPPASAQQGAATRDAGGGPAFDVSDVDVTNFPEIDINVCAREIGYGCKLWLDFPGVGIAGMHGGGGARYYQIKDLPTDEEELEALKHRLVPCHDVVGQCPYTHEDGSRRIANRTSTLTVEIIPVRYDFQDLWRWAIVLERFSRSAANTIGIIGAGVSWNQQLTGGGVVYPRVFLNGLSAASGPADIRETIMVRTRGDQQVVVDALPTLLPLLGIPVDAVGVVHRRH